VFASHRGRNHDGVPPFENADTSRGGAIQVRRGFADMPSDD
jgi:hypothetical protein